MKLISKLAAATAAAAIGTTGLVAATGTSASAAAVTKSVTYNCDLSALGQGTQKVTTAYTLPALPAVIPAGTKVPALPVSAKITVPAAVSAVVVGGFHGHISGTVSGNAAFGPQAVASTLTIPDQTISDPAAPATVNASGTLASFTASHAGANAVSLPSAVTATLGGVPISCTAAPGSNLSLGTVNVVKVLDVTAPKKVKLGKAVKLQVTTSETGKAVAKIKGKKVASATVKGGKATLKIKKGLKKGTNKIVVSVGSLKKTVKVKVTK